MPTEEDFTTTWASNTSEERRARLDELGAIEDMSDDQRQEHDALATLVAFDENDVFEDDEDEREEDGTEDRG